MASINDVNNSVQQVNASVLKVRSSVSNLNDSVQSEITATNNITTGIDNVNTSVNTLDADVKTGFGATVQGLVAIAQIEEAVATLVFHLTQQADTMICALQQISQNTCGILTQATIQTQLQRRVAHDIKAIRDIQETVHPEAALELQRLAALRAQVEKCCPPAPPEPACTYSPCPSPAPIQMPGLPKFPVTHGDPAGTQ